MSFDVRRPRQGPLFVGRLPAALEKRIPVNKSNALDKLRYGPRRAEQHRAEMPNPLFHVVGSRSSAGPPVHQNQAKVDTIDNSILVDVDRGVFVHLGRRRAPCSEHHPDVRRVDYAVG